MKLSETYDKVLLASFFLDCNEMLEKSRHFFVKELHEKPCAALKEDNLNNYRYVASTTQEYSIYSYMLTHLFVSKACNYEESDQNGIWLFEIASTFLYSPSFILVYSMPVGYARACAK
jgi:hypothetical protein